MASSLSLRRPRTPRAHGLVPRIGQSRTDLLSSATPRKAKDGDQVWSYRVRPSLDRGTRIMDRPTQEKTSQKGKERREADEGVKAAERTETPS